MQPLSNSETAAKDTVPYKTARKLSTLFVPPTLSLFTFSYLGLHLEASFNKSVLVLGATLVLTFLLPIVFFIIMLKKKRIVNQDAEMKEERTIPFLFGLSLLLLGYLLLWFNNVQPLILALWFSYISNMAVIILINKFWKISIHAMGIAGPLAMFVFMGNWIAYPLLIILFLVGWSRINLKCHTFAQVIAGGIFGFLSTFLQLYLFLR